MVDASYFDRRRSQQGADTSYFDRRRAPETSWVEDAVGYVNKGVQSAAQGATLGFADEIGAALDSIPVAAYRSLVKDQPFDVGRAYDDRLAAYRGDLKDFRDEYPVSAFATEVAGNVGGTLAALPYLPARAAAAIAPSSGASLSGRTLAGAGTGVGMGATYGAGSAEGGAGERLKGAAIGGTVGGVVGAAAPSVIQGVGKGAQYLADQTINRIPSRAATAAQRKVAEAILRDFPDMSADDALAAAAKRVEQLGPEAALLDVGPNTQSLARGAYTVPGESRTAIGDFLKTRQEGSRGTGNVLQGGQINRISAALDDVTPARARGTMDELNARRMLDASPKYEQAFSKSGIYTDRLQQFLDDPTARAGLKRGLEIQRLESLAQGKPFNPRDAAIVAFNEAGDPVIGDVPNMRTYDAIKRGIDAMIDGETDAVTGKISERGRALVQVKQAFVGELDRLNPAYAEARAAYSGPSQLIDAMNLGSRFMNRAAMGNADDLAAQIKGMSPDELHHFRIGAVQQIRDKLNSLNTRSDATKRLMDIPDLENRIRLAFGDDATFSQYIQMLQNERQMFDTYGKIMGGSRTAEVLAEQADSGFDRGRIAQGVASVVQPVSPMDFLRGVGDIAGGMKDRATITGPVSGRLSNLLLGRSVEPMRTAMRSAEMSDAQRRSLARMLLSSGVVGAGRASPQGQ